MFVYITFLRSSLPELPENVFSLKVYKHFIKYLYMNSEQQTNKVTKSNIFFFESLANDTAMFSEHFEHLKRSRLQKKFCVAVFLIRNICLKTFVFLISESC